MSSKMIKQYGNTASRNIAVVDKKIQPLKTALSPVIPQTNRVGRYAGAERNTRIAVNNYLIIIKLDYNQKPEIIKSRNRIFYILFDKGQNI